LGPPLYVNLNFTELRTICSNFFKVFQNLILTTLLLALNITTSSKTKKQYVKVISVHFFPFFYYSTYAICGQNSGLNFADQ
jgi:hypothetical protein